jgi:hypothetical protein
MKGNLLGLGALILVPLALGGLVALALATPWASSTGSASPDGSMTCTVKPICAPSEVAVFRLSYTSNAHAGTRYGSAYGNRVCCTEVSGLGTDCGATPHAVVLSLSATDNAHVASDGSYATDVCLSGGDDATVDCAYGASCDVDYACLATISGTTNAHVADCDGVNDYATKVCCLVTPDNCPTVPNPGQENADGDEWGDACDNCADVATVWLVPPGDTDCDGFTDTVEGVVGTDAGDACPDWTGTSGLCPGSACDGDDVWPADLDVNRAVNVLDILFFKPVLGGPYDARYDLNGDSAVNVLDVLAYKPFLNTSCTNP